MRAALLLVLVVVVGAVAGGLWFLLSGDGGEEAATATADGFVAAWSAEDWAGLSTLADNQRAPDAHAEALEALDPASVRVTLTDLDLERLDEGIASARYEAAYELEGLGTWTHEGTFEVVEREDEGEWLVAWEPSVVHPDLEEGRSLRRTRFWPDRAPITGPGGIDLAGEGDVVIVGVEPQRVDDEDEVVEAIDELTPASAEDAEAVLGRGDLRSDWFYEIVRMPRSAYDEVREELRPVPGLVFQEETDRAGASEATEELVGTVGEITAEQLERLGEPYREGDLVGASGLEASLEERLAGEPGGAVILVDEDGEEVETLHEFEPTEPESVELTLDIATQDAAAAAMADVEAGGLVAIDTETGAVRAAVSRPANGIARAFTGQYAPGSTFKVVTAAALLLDGMGPDDTLDCSADINAGGRAFRNAEDAELGEVSLTEAFAQSCNTAFIDAAAALGDDALGEAAQRFGFSDGDEAGYPVAGRRVPASFPPPQDAAEAAAAAIGQGRVAASPTQMASVAATAVTGTLHRPYLLTENAGEGQEAVPDEVAETLRDLMRAVVTEGTGTAADVGDVVGKTGTAEHGDDAEHAWFIGESAGLAFAVVVEEGGAGGSAAAPVAADFLEGLGR